MQQSWRNPLRSVSFATVTETYQGDGNQIFYPSQYVGWFLLQVFTFWLSWREWPCLLKFPFTMDESCFFISKFCFCKMFFVDDMELTHFEETLAKRFSGFFVVAKFANFHPCFHSIKCNTSHPVHIVLNGFKLFW